VDATTTPIESTPAAHPVPDPGAAPMPRGFVIGGVVLTGLVAAFLLLDGALRIAGFAPYVERTVQSGFPASMAPGIGLALLIPTLLFLFPRTAVLGAILVTAYLGGATVTNLRLGTGIAFPVVFGILVWAALWLRDAELRRLVPLRGRGG
jgi:hypothetical protein